MPTGRCHCVRSPGERRQRDEAGERKKGRKEKVRNEGRAAVGRRNIVLNKYEPHSSLTLSLTFEAIAVAEVHALHAHGKFHLPDIPCKKGRMKGGKK
jgi:hypothetical protein